MNSRKEVNLANILEQKKEQIEKDFSKTDVKFHQSKGEMVEEEFKKYTVGLSTREEFKKKHENIHSIIKRKLDNEQEKEEIKKKKMAQKRKEEYKKAKNNLCFMEDDEEEEEGDGDDDDDEDDDNSDKNEQKQENLNEKIQKDKKENDDVDTFVVEKQQGQISKKEQEEGDIIKKKMFIGKNPNAVTHFLPDMERDRQNYLKKEQLKLEYLERKEKLENQFLEIQYSYWDGFKVIKSMRIRQKMTVLDFLDQCRKSLIQEYPHLANMKAMEFIGVARDEVLSSKMSFYEIIETNLKNHEGDKVFNFIDKKEIDPLGKEIIVSEDKKTVVMIIEKKVLDKPGENPLYFFLKNIKK